MSTTRRTASSSREGASRKCGVSPRSAAARTMPQRSRTAAALSSSAASAGKSSIVEGTTLGAAELQRTGDAQRREIAGSLLRLDLDCSVERHQPIRDRDLLDYLDPLRLERVVLQVRHRDPAVDAADPEPMEDIRHQLLKPHVLHAGDAFGAAEIGVGPIAAQLTLTSVVDEEFGDLAKRSPLLAVVDDDPDPALLRGLDADFYPVHEIRAARADIRAEDIRAVALVVNAAGDYRVRFGDPLDITKEIDRRAADRRQQDLNIGPGDQLREHAPGLLEKRTPQIGLGDAKAGGQPRQMPYRVDCRFGDTDFAIVEQHPAVGPQCAVGEKRAKFRRGEPRPRDGDGRTRVDTGADMFGENLADEVAPGIERHDLRRIGPLRMGADQHGGRSVGEIGAVITRQGSRRDREGAIDRVSAGVGPDSVT